jgi:hypothetical protein
MESSETNGVGFEHQKHERLNSGGWTGFDRRSAADELKSLISVLKVYI